MFVFTFNRWDAAYGKFQYVFFRNFEKIRTK